MTDTTLATLDKAVFLLAQAHTAPEIKQIVDLAEAARVYAKQANLSAEAVNYAAEIKLRAERKLGEVLRVTPKNNGGWAEANLQYPEGTARAPKLGELGISKKQSSRAQQIATVPVEAFEQHLETKKAKGEEITTAALLREATTEQRHHDRLEKLVHLSRGNSPLEDIGHRFPIIYADPPWQYDANTTDPSRVIENQYPTMSIDDLMALPVGKVVTEEAILFLWATSPLLTKAIQLITAWEFAYQSSMVWVKDKIGMGYWVRSQHELLLIATRGNPPKPAPADRPSSVIHAPRGEHSAKPHELYTLINRMYPTLPKLELFARAHHEGFVAWGNQS